MTIAAEAALRGGDSSYRLARAEVKGINSKAEVAQAQAALAVNICAARGLQDVLRTNLGPKGTMKMLVSGAGDMKLTKDGNVLLHEMGLHPRIIAEGFEVAKIKALEVLEQVKIKKEMKREILLDVARTSLQTKVHPQLAYVLTEAVVDSVLAIRRPGYPIDLLMVEIMEMKHKSETDTKPLTVVASPVAEHRLQTRRLSSHGSRAQPLRGTWDLPGPGHEPMSPASAGGLSTTAPSGKPENGIREVFKATGNFLFLKLGGCVVPGAGAVEVAIAEALVTYKHSIKGRARLGVQAFADALLIIPKVLAQNSGYDLQETLVKVQVEHSESKQPVGIDLNTGEPMVAADAGVWDNYFVKNQLLHSCTVIATNILLVDEIMGAGMSSLKG
ncbi:T-complex protein 1 subunit zeta-2 [Globicephala melas]|uniref:T-complex protein 1 subunit zeta-2 n=1 Tax=Globicephala melas TaxID=9731 RepID=UPI0038737FFD